MTYLNGFLQNAGKHRLHKIRKLTRHFVTFSIIALAAESAFSVTICAGSCPPDLAPPAPIGGGVIVLDGGSGAGTISIGGSGGGSSSSGGVLIIGPGGDTVVSIASLSLVGTSAYTDTNLIQIGREGSRNLVRLLADMGGSFSDTYGVASADISELLMNGIKVADAGASFSPSWLTNSSDKTATKSSFWISPLAGYSTSINNASQGYRTRSSGIVFGIERGINEHTLAGVAYSNSLTQSADVGGSIGRSHVGSDDLAAYVEWRNGVWSNKAIIGAGWQHYSTFGFGTQGATNGNSISGYDELGYKVAISDSVAIRPVAILSLSRTSFDSFSENAGGTAIRVSGRQANSEIAGLGIKAVREFGGEMKLRLEGRALCFHEFGDVSARWNAQGSGFALGIVSPDTPRNSILLGGRISGQSHNGFSLYADLSEEAAGNGRNYLLAGGLRYVY